MAKEIKYSKDKDSKIQIRVNSAKKNLYIKVVKDVSKDINDHIDNTIRNHTNK